MELVKILSLVAFCGQVAFSIPIGEDLPKDCFLKLAVQDILSKNPTFEAIGQNGSIFYINDNVKENWQDARSKCQTAGAQFAEFDTYEDFNFVRNVTKNGEFWVGASVKGIDNDDTAKTFEWQSSKTPLEQMLPFNHYAKHWVCLYMDGDHIYTDLCLAGLHKALCQIKV